jgi:hypothetical protein
VEDSFPVEDPLGDELSVVGRVSEFVVVLAGAGFTMFAAKCYVTAV